MKLCDLYSKLPFLTVSSVFVFGFSFKGASKQKIPFCISQFNYRSTYATVFKQFCICSDMI